MLLFIEYYFINSLNVDQTLPHVAGTISFDIMEVTVNRCKFHPVDFTFTWKQNKVRTNCEKCIVYLLIEKIKNKLKKWDWSK